MKPEISSVRHDPKKNQLTIDFMNRTQETRIHQNSIECVDDLMKLKQKYPRFLIINDNTQRRYWSKEPV